MSKEKVMLTHQICNHCLQYLPISSFSKHKTMRSGFLKICKVCENTKNKAYRKTNKYRERISKYKECQETFSLNNPLITCVECHERLPIISFHKDKTSKSGVKRVCKDCIKFKRDKYRQSDKYKNKAQETIRKRENGELEITHRICTKCQQDLPITSYRKSNIVNSGYMSTCKECKRIENIEYCQTKEYKEYSKKRRQTQEYKDWCEQYRKLEYVKEIERKSGIKHRQSLKYREWLEKYKKSGKYKEKERRFHQTEKGKASQARHTYKRRGQSQNLPSTLTAQEWKDIQKRYNYKCVYCGEKKPLTKDHIIPLSKGGPYTKENILPACRSCNSIKHTKPVLQQLLAMDKPKTSYSA